MSSLKFGTSGLRGLAADLDGAPAYAYTRAFLLALDKTGALQIGQREIVVGRDLRPSSPSIAARCLAAIADAGFTPRDAGAVPTPALALEAIGRGAASIMVTGSHIPFDRNGLKFYRPDGEIDKNDELAISAAHASLPPLVSASDAKGGGLPLEVLQPYHARAVRFFGAGALNGLRVGAYQHSSVARDVLCDILADLGATVTPLGRSETFLPVDTEAVREEDRALALEWAKAEAFDAIVSTDGDADRPLIADATGTFLRGDAVGALTARFVAASTVVTPVTSNSRLEAPRLFPAVLRTKVGSPFVLAAMAGARHPGSRVVGFEANGGVLLGDDVQRNGRMLGALPTRDAVLPICAILASIKEQNVPLSRLVSALGLATAASMRLEHIPQQAAAAFLARIAQQDAAQALFAAFGTLAGCDTTDGLRFRFANGDILHFRASGNAPEFRIYVETLVQGRTQALLEKAGALAAENLS